MSSDTVADDVTCYNAALPEDTLFDPWHWLAIGTEPDGASEWQMHEYEPDTGVHRPFAQALEHLGRLTKLVLLPQYPDRYPGLQPLVCLVPDGAHAVFWRRRSLPIILDASAPDPEPAPRITGIGWQHGSVQSLIALYDDGSAVLTADRNSL